VEELKEKVLEEEKERDSWFNKERENEIEEDRIQRYTRELRSKMVVLNQLKEEHEEEEEIFKRLIQLPQRVPILSKTSKRCRQVFYYYYSCCFYEVSGHW